MAGWATGREKRGSRGGWECALQESTRRLTVRAVLTLKCALQESNL